MHCKIIQIEFSVHFSLELNLASPFEEEAVFSVCFIRAELLFFLANPNLCLLIHKGDMALKPLGQSLIVDF